MMNRRQFLSTAAAGAAAFTHFPIAFAAQRNFYDLIIRGGRVIDPSARLDAASDIAIAGGRMYLRTLTHLICVGGEPIAMNTPRPDSVPLP